MVEWEWGEDEQPSSFGLSSSCGEPVYSDQPDDVPEVRAARARNYFPAHEAPLWCFIPAIWPSEARAWVHDRRVRHSTRLCDGGPLERLPWTAADYADIENDTNALLAELGLPPRPRAGSGSCAHPSRTRPRKMSWMTSGQGGRHPEDLRWPLRSSCSTPTAG
ncbi:DUF5956 family protein [Nocardioides salarius]|uniref:DUF5956 family protein n=1 Tax=Nocardioides salarius TaxID=374513 RepID=UPI003C6E2A84